MIRTLSNYTRTSSCFIVDTIRILFDAVKLIVYVEANLYNHCALLICIRVIFMSSVDDVK